MTTKRNPPPQTTRQAKRAFLRSKKLFTPTPSQLRAGERRQELEERAKKLSEKEERKKANKRKRAEKEEKERAAKRRQLSEGKISIEDTWDKIGLSQPRLHSYFAKPKSAQPEPQPVGRQKSRESECSSEQETFLDPMAKKTEASQRNSTPSAQQVEEMSTTTPTRDAQLAAGQIRDHDITPPKRDDSITNSVRDGDNDLPDAELRLSQSSWDFDIAEDESAETFPQEEIPLQMPANLQKACASPAAFGGPSTSTPTKRKADYLLLETPVKSARSALSEMSPSKVNIRAIEKPDTTSAAPAESSLPSPEQEKILVKKIAADTLAMISTQDLEDDEFSFDKENQDPSLPPSLAKISSLHRPPAKQSGRETSNLQYNQRPSSDKLLDLDDFDDILNSSDDSEDDDFEDGLDDESLAAIAASQRLGKDVLVTKQGSPKKISPQLVSKPPVVTTAPEIRSMAPPFLKSSFSSRLRAARAPKPDLRNSGAALQYSSFTFDGVEDGDLAELAAQLETQKNEGMESDDATEKKASRYIPWLHTPTTNSPDPSQESMDRLTPSVEATPD